MKLRSILVGLLSFSPLAAQGQVWTVDDTAATTPDFTDLQTAIDTVANGDILLVRDGIYPQMRIDGKALTIQADSGAVVNVRDLSDPPSVSCGTVGASICNLSASQCVRLRGLALTARGQGLLLKSNAGTVWIEDCSITCLSYTAGPFGECDGSGAGISATDCADVVLVRSTLLGTDGEGGIAFACGTPDPRCIDSSHPQAGPGLLVVSSNVHAFGCAFTGGGGIGWLGSCECAPQKGGYGIRGSGEPALFLFLSGCTVQGGQGVGCVFDKVCFPCTDHNPGGDGLYWAGQAAVLDSSIQGGAAVPGGGTCDSCPPLTDGVPIVALPELDLELVPGSALCMQMTSPVRENGLLTLEFDGPPDAPVWLLVSTRLAPFYLDIPPYPRGSLLPGAPLTNVFLGRTDAGGTLQRTFTLAPMPVGVEGRLFFGQGVALVPSSPVLGEGSMLVALDEAF